MSYTDNSFSSVYGPVKSWRFGQSLGIDPIGGVSTCSFNCVYCQLGEIEYQTQARQMFISTEQIQQDLQVFAPWDVDIVTVSGSGEPTLAENLGEILTTAKTITKKPVAVLTNGSLLTDPNVRAELAIADRVAVKVDAVNVNSFQRINRPVEGLDLEQLWSGLLQFRQQYSGILLIQTMLLSAWSDRQQAEYITLMRKLLPDEIQLNTPTRPKPTCHELDARGNHTPGTQSYPVRVLKPLSVEQLQTFRDRIQAAIGIPTCYPQHQLSLPRKRKGVEIMPNSQQESVEIKRVEIPPGHLNIMGYIDESEVNGPGCRAVIWVQGCLRECPGCFNPASWSFEPNQIVSVDDLLARILAKPRNEGVTFSGGEPFWQAPALAQLAHQAKAKGLNVMSFTGFTLEELRRADAPPGSQALLNELDILVDGPYVESLAVHSPDSLVSSRNQRVHVFSPALRDRLNWASDQIEIHILKDGSRLITGYRGQMNLSE